MIRGLFHPSGKRRRELLLGWFLLGGMAAIAVYAFFWREAGTPTIQCAFRMLWGLYCPSCGLTRAIHHILHGELLSALRMNAPMVFLLPFAAYIVLEEGIRLIAGRTVLPQLPLSPWIAGIVGGGLVLFGILRNIPALAFLAPV